MNTFLTSLGSISVVQAQVRDVDAILAILNGAGNWLTERGIDQWQPGRFTQDRGVAAIERSEAYIAKVGDETVGTLWLQQSDAFFWGQRPDDALYVHALAVKRSYAGHQIGQGLLNWAECQVTVAGRAFLRLDCMAANPALRSYYLKAGFVFVGEVQKHGWNAALFERKAKAIGEVESGIALLPDVTHHKSRS